MPGVFRSKINIHSELLVDCAVLSKIHGFPFHDQLAINPDTRTGVLPPQKPDLSAGRKSYGQD